MLFILNFIKTTQEAGLKLYLNKLFIYIRSMRGAKKDSAKDDRIPVNSASRQHASAQPSDVVKMCN